MKKKLLITVMVLALMCLFAFSISAASVEIDFDEEVTLEDGTVLPLYNDQNQALIWFVKDAAATGADRYASVVANRSTADNATSYINYNINSTYGTNQMHDLYIHYWDAETSSYVSYGEKTVVIFNIRDLEIECWALGDVFSADNLEYVYHSKNVRDAGDFTDYKKLKVVDLSLSTDYASFSQQAFRNCTALHTFKIGASASGYAFDCTYGCLFSGCTSLSTFEIGDPSAVTAIGGNAFENCYALSMNYEFKNVKTIGNTAFKYAGKNEGCSLIFSFPALTKLGTTGDTHVFSYSGLEEISFGASIASMSFNTFTNCTRLWRIEFAGAAEGFNFPSYTFEGCTALKAFSVPEGMTALPSRMFSGCTSLTAVYLPSTLTAINSGAQAHSTFYNCQQMYFVDKAFTYDSVDDIPAKPDVYFFPSKLTTLTSETFKACRSLNNTLVFPTGVTQIPSEWAFEAGINNPTLQNIVFLGDMTSVASNSWRLTGKIYFCNANDVDATSAGFDGKRSAVFCNAAGNTTHLTDPRKTQTTEADCENNEKHTTYCFCTALIGTAEVENSALGHNHDLENGATLLDIVYADYSKDGYKVVKCSRCDNENNEQKANAIIYDFTGYSTKIDGNGITFGYSIDREALAELKAFSANLQVGFVAAAAPLLGDNMPLDANADPTVLQKGNVIKTDISQYDDISKVDFVLVGSMWDSKFDLDGDGDAETPIKDIKFVMCGYVYAKDAVQYIGANGASEELPGISYGEI